MNAIETNGTFAPCCFSLSSLSLRHSFHQICHGLQMSGAFPKVQLDVVSSFTAQILIQSSNLERLSPDALVSCPDH